MSWKYQKNFDDILPNNSFGAELRGATNDLVHTIVIDEDGLWTGTKGSVLERYVGRSKAPNAKDSQGRNFSINSDQRKFRIYLVALITLTVLPLPEVVSQQMELQVIGVRMQMMESSIKP